MKKFLLLSLILTMTGATAVFAAEPTTYSEALIQKHTQKLVDKEKELQQQQKAREEARLQQQKAREEAQLKQREELERKLNPLKAKQEELEQQKKAREEAQEAQRKKIERKKELFNELMQK